MQPKALPLGAVLAGLLLLLLGGCSSSTGPDPSGSNTSVPAFSGEVDPLGSAFVLARVEQADPGRPGIIVDLIGSNLRVDADLETVSLDVAIRNESSEPLFGPLVVWLGQFVPDAVRPINADFVESDSTGEVGPFPYGYDYTSLLGDHRVLEPRETSGRRTWSFHDPGLPPFRFAARVEASSAPVGAHISGVVFLDTNQNGAFDPDERPLGAGVVQITRPGGETDMAHPNETGRYAFRIAAPGLYTLSFSAPFSGPSECYTTPNPLQVVVLSGPDGRLQSVDDADFGYDRRPCHGDIAPAVMTDLEPGDIEQDPYDLRALSLRGDILVLRVGFSGCQPEHPFTLYVSKNFMESYPVQTWALLAHDNLGEDPCDAYWEKTLVFDLSPLREAYVAAYGGPDLIWVRFRDFSGDEQRFLFGP